MILLIQPKTGSLERAGYRLPLGLLYLAAYLKKYSISADILDVRINKNWEKELSQKLKKINYVGITCFIGPMIEYSIEIAKLIKRINPEISIIMGGVHPSLVPEQVLEIPEIDIVVRGEGEYPLKDILLGKKIVDISGISYRDKNGKIIHNASQSILPGEQIPIPDYRMIDMDKYSATTYSNEKSASIMSSRGCPYKCGFCYLCNDDSWRPFPVETVVKNASILIKEYNIKTLYFEDDNVAVDSIRFFQILNKLKPYNVNLAFQGIRIDTINKFSEDMLKEMHDCGVKSLDVGVETISDRLLNKIDKKLTREMILSVAKKLRKFDFNIKFNFIAGMPGQTNLEVKEDLEIIKKLTQEHKNSFVLFNVYMPFPGTNLYGEALEAGFKPPKDFLGWSVFAGTKWMKEHSWLSEYEQKRLEALRFLFIFSNKNILSKVNRKFVRLLIKIYYPLAKFRISREWYGFFIEKKIANLFKINI